MSTQQKYVFLFNVCRFGRRNKMLDGEFVTDYSDSLFWEKIKKYAALTGATVAYAAFIVYYALNSDHIPAKIKAMLYSALGYFINPLDVIPDMTPAIGYADDLAILTAVIRVIAFYITAAIREKAKNRVKDLFGDGEAFDAMTSIGIRIEKQPEARI